MKEKVQINIYIVLIVLVLIGSINWGLVGIFDFDLVKSFSSLFGTYLQNDITAFIYILVAMSALVLLIQRNTYLPFLGKTVIPQPMTNYKPNGNLISKVVTNLPPNVKVVYWAALPSDTIIDNPDDAYGNYSNQGVTTTDTNGNAILEVQNPASYKIPAIYDPFQSTLKPHIHYRYWTPSGMTSSLFTEKL